MTLLSLAALSVALPGSNLAGKGTITIDVDRPGARVAPGLYGVFLEEINNSTDGGLYAEMIQNRGFEDANLPPACTLQGTDLATPKNPSYWEGFSKDWTMPWPYAGMGSTPYWSLSGGKMSVTTEAPITPANPHAVDLEVSGSATLVNDGYWGMAVQKGAKYNLSVYLRPKTFQGKLEARLVSPTGDVLARTALPTTESGKWTKLAANLQASATEPKAKFELVATGQGHLLVDFVSLFPQKTFKNRPNGLRPDLVKMIQDLKPGFVRWPGGCVVEGITIETRPQWEQTLGPIEGRTPTFVPWAYWTSNGFGYHEWLQFCEDIGAEPLYVFNVGVACAFRSGTFIPDDELQPLIDDTLNAIEYAVGPVTSKYGAMRAKAGHPKPFAMNMVEIGNEEQGPKYGARVKRFMEAIKAKYPKMKVALSSWISGIDQAAINAAGPDLDVVDEHAYRAVNWSIQNFDAFDRYSREVPWELYIGEFATNGGVGRGNLLAALGDAAYMMSMEKNADLVKMGSYAPLLENVNRRQWEVNLIHFDGGWAYGRAAYYACKMFADHLPSVVLPAKTDFVPAGAAPISGPIGLGTYGTSAEFRNIEVNGKPISGDWRQGAGTWSEDRGVYRQTGRDHDLWSYFAGDYHDMTLTLQARKVAGDEGFVVSVGNAERRRVQFNIGGWGNRQHVIEAQGVVKQVRGSVEAGKWYDIKVETRGRQILAYLDGKLIFDETLPRIDRVLATAGKDDKTGDVIVKVLNPSDKPAEIAFNLNGMKVKHTATLTRLSGTDPNAENSREAPTRLVPEISKVHVSASGFKPVIPAYSISIYRFPTR